MLQTLVHIFIK